MNAKEIVALREESLSALSEATNGDMEKIKIVADITAKHRLLPIPSSKLVVRTYKGIIGYLNWLKENQRPTDRFFSTAMHDLVGALDYKRDDGYCPRSSPYVKFYKVP